MVVFLEIFVVQKLEQRIAKVCCNRREANKWICLCAPLSLPCIRSLCKISGEEVMFWLHVYKKITDETLRFLKFLKAPKHVTYNCDIKQSLMGVYLCIHRAAKRHHACITREVCKSFFIFSLHPNCLPLPILWLASKCSIYMVDLEQLNYAVC